jgi:hypothetical protein
LAGLSHRSKIYVHGHGAPGDHTIDPDNTGNQSLKYDTVCNMLIAKGLRKGWMGELVFACCDGARTIVGSQGFAYKGAWYLRKRGYLLIRYKGYLGAVDGVPDYSDSGSRYKHRYVTLFGHEVKSKWGKISV